MKKYVVTTFLVVVLTIISIVPAFAVSGFGGGTRPGNFGGGGFGSDTTESWYDYIAWRCYEIEQILDNSIDPSLDSIISALSTANSTLSTISSRLYTTIDGSRWDVAQLLGSIRSYNSSILSAVNSIDNKLATSTDNGFRDVSQLLLTSRNSLFDIVDLLGDVVSAIEDNAVTLQVPSDWNLTLPDDITVSSSYDDSRVRSSISDVERAVSSLDFNVTHYLRDQVLSEQLISNSHLQSIENALSNIEGNQIDISAFTAAINSISDNSVSPINPFTRKIYNVLYNGVDGAGSDMVDVAVSQVGVVEGQPYYSWYGFNSHVNWCACYVSWCADQCGYLDTSVPRFCLVEDGIAWYQSRGLWQSAGYEPMPGDIIFFDWENDHSPDHVGIVADCSDGIITSVEGNMGDAPGVVSSRTLSVDSSVIYGYGTPDYPAGGASIYSVLTDISRKLDHIGDFEPVVVGSDEPITGSVYSTYYVPGETTSTPGLNNLCTNGNFDDVSYFTTRDCSYSVSNHIAEITSSVDSASAIYNAICCPVRLFTDHTYFVSFDILYPSTFQPRFYYARYGIVDSFSVGGVPDSWNSYGLVFRPTQEVNPAVSNASGIWVGFGHVNTHVSSGEKMYLKNYWVIDLTEMYGAGNEPTIGQFRNEYPDISYNSSSLIPVTEEINIDNSTYLPLDVDSQEYVIGDFTAHSDTMSFTVTADTVPDLRVVACLPNGNQIVCNNIIENVNALDDEAGASVTYQVSLPASIPWVDSWNIRLDGAHLTSIGCFNFLNLGASARAELQLLSNISGGGVGAGYDDTVLISKLTDIENALSNLGDNVSVSIEQVSNVDIAIDNSAHDVFYVTDDDGEKSIVDLSGDSIKVVGKLMNFLYQAMFKDALDDAGSGIDGLYDFYLDDSEGVDVWAS